MRSRFRLRRFSWSASLVKRRTDWPNRFVIYEAWKDQAAYDANVATYRQTVLTAFQQVEDNLAALRILEQEAVTQAEAVELARQSTELTLNQYKAGTVNYLSVVVVQAAHGSAPAQLQDANVPQRPQIR